MIGINGDDDILDFLVLIKSLIMEKTSIDLAWKEGNDCNDVCPLIFSRLININYCLIAPLRSYLERLIECEDAITSASEENPLSEACLETATNIVNESKQYLDEKVFSIMVSFQFFLSSIFYFIFMIKGPTNVGNHGSETSFNNQCPWCDKSHRIHTNSSKHIQ